MFENVPEFTILGHTFDALNVGTWALAGLVLAVLFVGGKRPLGFIGDIIMGVIGGFLAGFLGQRIGFDFAEQIATSGGLESSTAGYLSSFISGLLGALVLLILLRVFVRR